MIWLLFHIFTNISSKVDMKFILWFSILMDCSCFSPIAWKSMNDYNWMIILPLLKFCVWSFVLYLFVLTPLPNGYMCCFNHPHNLNCWVQYLTLLNLYLRDPSLERKASFFLKVVFCWYLKITFHNLRYILSDNKLAPLPGSEGSNLTWLWTA